MPCYPSSVSRILLVAYSLRNASETHKRRSFERRVLVLNAFWVVVVLIIVARLIELQLVRGSEYSAAAQAQHFGGVVLPAKRGEVLGVNSKTGETNIFATNTTLDLVYVDPLITDDPAAAAGTLSQILLTPEFHDACSQGLDSCPRELIPFYSAAFDPLQQLKIRQSGAILEPLPPGQLPASILKLPNLVQARDSFAHDIERRISEKRVTFAPIKYGATKLEMTAAEKLDIPGVTVSRGQSLISADPEEINQSLADEFAGKLAGALQMDAKVIRPLLHTRPLRYIEIMRRLPLALSRKILEAKTASAKEELAKVQKDPKRNVADLNYPLRGIALIPEHWRFYPDTTIASHVIGFLNTNQEAQYGIERTYDPQLRGKEGLINTVSDPKGGQILRPEQTIVDPQDGDSVVLTLDRTIQKEVETVLDKAVKTSKATSGQAIVMDPYTGRVLAMANAPLFNSNDYSLVNQKEPISIDANNQQKIVVEVFNPETHARVVKDYKDHVLTASGRQLLPPKVRKTLEDLEQLYTLQDLARYYQYIGVNTRREIFATDRPDVWLKFKNDLGIGAYLNRTIQEIYEPGSVMKPLNMAIAIDQGEVTPYDTYDDFGTVQVDDYQIDNNDHHHYGHVTMTNCLEFSINTCMTSVSARLGPKLFYSELQRFGFGQITNIELEDELPGEVRPWREWSRSLLATTAFGQGISVTPMQIITAWSALANGGKLMRPTIIDRIIHADGTVEKTEPHLVDQVITPAASDTITAMLVSSATRGFAKSGRPSGYRIAAKTGTSQIAGPGGKYETGTGATFATYAGYAPVDHPRFVVLVKIDRPKVGIQGATVAGPIFKEIAAFLFNYYGLPPDGPK